MRLIDAENLAKTLKEAYCLDCSFYNVFKCHACRIGDALDIINNFEDTVDHVKHGEWDCIDFIYRCKVCNAIIDTRGSETDWNYCPNCGAIMDEEVHE